MPAGHSSARVSIHRLYAYVTNALGFIWHHNVALTFSVEVKLVVVQTGIVIEPALNPFAIAVYVDMKVLIELDNALKKLLRLSGSIG